MIFISLVSISHKALISILFGFEHNSLHYLFLILNYGKCLWTFSFIWILFKCFGVNLDARYGIINEISLSPTYYNSTDINIFISLSLIPYLESGNHSHLFNFSLRLWFARNFL